MSIMQLVRTTSHTVTRIKITNTDLNTVDGFFELLPTVHQHKLLDKYHEGIVVYATSDEPLSEHFKTLLMLGFCIESINVIKQ